MKNWKEIEVITLSWARLASLERADE